MFNNGQTPSISQCRLAPNLYEKGNGYYIYRHPQTGKRTHLTRLSETLLWLLDEIRVPRPLYLLSDELL